MERHPVDSKLIASRGYDPATQTLEIEFNGGKVYQYQGVTQDAYDAFTSDESAGKHFHRAIKGRYEFKEVPTEQQPPDEPI